MLDHNGAHEVAGEGWLKEVNLVVSNSMKFEGWEEVKERNESKGEEEGVYVVTDKWVDRSLVLGKTQSYVLSFSTEKNKINAISENTNLLVHTTIPPTHP